jgi:hypothetical protein
MGTGPRDVFIWTHNSLSTNLLLVVLDTTDLIFVTLCVMKFLSVAENDAMEFDSGSPPRATNVVFQSGRNNELFDGIK